MADAALDAAVAETQKLLGALIQKVGLSLFEYDFWFDLSRFLLIRISLSVDRSAEVD